jgi:flagellar assembly factor FliW
MQPLVPSSPASTAALVPDAGRIEPAPKDVIMFPDGLPGFEACRRFLAMSSDDIQPFQCLQGLDGSRPSFVTIDPARVLDGYRLILSPADCRRLDAKEDDALLWLAIVTVGVDGTAIVNLRAPLVINARLMIGYQVMPYDCLYPLRHPLSL